MSAGATALARWARVRTTTAGGAAVAAGGTQAFYDWNEVSLLDAGGRHRQIIPDGKLCSAGIDRYVDELCEHSPFKK